MLSETHILKKYQFSQELLLDYWERQELECFLNDNLNLASAAFGRTICILCLDKEGYLCQSFITCCKNHSKNYIYLAKVVKKFYCVFQTTAHAHIQLIKEAIVDELVNSVLQRVEGKKNQKEEKVIVHHYDQVHHRRQHKKSLSDCDQLPIPALLVDRKKQFEESSDRGTKPPNVRLFDSTEVVTKTEGDYFDLSYQSRASYKSADESGRAYPETYGYFPYHYSYYPQHDSPYLTQEQYQPQQPYCYAQPFGPINNQRYTGRLKFFDQNGNYGFLVIDNLNIDVFVHHDDLSKAGLNKEKLSSMKNHYDLRFEFTYYEYEGKQQKKSKKAIDLKMIVQ